MIARGRGCGPCGVSILILSVIATAASTQPNTMILSIVIALGPFGADEGALVAQCRANRSSAVTDVTPCAEFDPPLRDALGNLWRRAKPLQRLAYCSVSAAALLPSATAELRSDIKLLLSVPFTCDPGHSACGRPIPRQTTATGSGGPCHLPVALMRGVHLLKPQGFHKREAHRSFPIQRIGQIGTLQAVTFGKRAYASFLRGCRFQQEKNVIVIQYEREIADVATCEQRGDFPFECDRNLSGHN